MINHEIKVIKKYYSFKADSKKYIVMACILTSLTNILILVIPYIAAKIIEFLVESNYLKVIYMLSILLVVYIIEFVLTKLYYKTVYQNAHIVHNNIQNKIISNVEKIDNNFLKKKSLTQLTSSIIQGIPDIHRFSDTLIQTIISLIFAVATIITLFIVNIYVGLISLIFAIGTICLITVTQFKFNHALYKEKQASDATVDYIKQVVDGKREVHVFNMEKQLDKEYEKLENQYSKIYFLKRKYRDRIIGIYQGLLDIIKLVIYAILIYLIFNMGYALETLVLVIGYYETLQSKVKQLYEKNILVLNKEADINRIYDILNYKKNTPQYGYLVKDNIVGNITFKEVNYSYKDKKILDNVSFNINKNQMVALIGHSSAGKSTIFNILMRLEKPSSGLITIDNIPINAFTRDVYISNVSVTNQKPFVFDMSVQENFDLIDNNKKNQKEVCKKVGLHDYLMEQEEGYKTNINTLPAYRKQLFLIARTLLTKAEILLFDEITANLDNTASLNIIKLLKKLKKDHTIIFITHKRELIQKADELILLENGKIISQGTYLSFKNNPIFKELIK